MLPVQTFFFLHLDIHELKHIPFTTTFTATAAAAPAGAQIFNYP